MSILDSRFTESTLFRVSALCAGILAVSYAVTMFFFSISTLPFPVCPLGGVGLAAVLLFAFRGRMELIAVLGTLGLAQFLTALSVGVSLPSSIGYAVEQPFTVLFAGWLLRRMGFRPTFDSVRDVILLICGALAVPLSSYVVHRISFYYLFDIYPRDPHERPWDFWNFIFTDGNAVLLLTPFLLFVAQRRQFFERRQAREAVLLFLGVTAFTGLLFFTPPFLVPFQGTLAYIAFPGVIWAGFRFGLPGVSAALMVLAIESLIGSKWGVLPFQSGMPKHDFMAFQFYLATTSLTGLLLGAVCQERRSFLARLQKSEGRFQALLDHSPMPILMKDTHGCIMLVNPAFERAVQLSAESIVGRTLNELVRAQPDASSLDGWLASLLRSDTEIVSTKRSTTFEITCPGADGEAHHSITKFPILDPSGEVKAIAVISVDLTKARHLEEQLRHSQKMEAIGRLAGGVAHDFNNILTVISLGIDELSERPGLSEPVRDTLQELLGQTERAANLTRQLLMFSRQSVLTMRPAHIAPVIEDSLKLLRPLLGELIEVEFRHADSLPWLVADTGMLEQVVVNLAVNARDAMPEGGRLTLELDAVQITPENLAIHPCGREGRFVRLTMHDTGQGIEPKMLSQIFQPFFTTKEVGKGSGLGLATVYGIVEQHNGWIEVESTPGEGSLFTIFLPAQDGPEPKPEVTQPLPTSSASAGSETILLVEDEPLARQKITHSLESTGYRVLAAESGPGALAIWSGHAGDIDLLLSDLVMPGGLSGFELAERLRRDKPMLKVIVSSGYNVELAIQNLERCGIEYLPKPYNARALAAAVRTCLDRKNPFAPAAIRPQAEDAKS